MFLPIFHLSVVVLNIYSWWYDQTYVDFPFSEEIKKYNAPLKNRVLFLTTWCLVLQTVYYTISFLNDIFGTNAPVPKKTSLIRELKDTVFSLAFPIALYVFLSFWGIYAIDKELIFPAIVLECFPAWLNHVMHSFILVFILIELLLTSRSYPSRKLGLSLMVSFVSGYIIVLFISVVQSEAWVYPVLELMNWPVRIIFFALSITFAVGLYIVGEKLNSSVSHRGNKEFNRKLKTN